MTHCGWDGVINRVRWMLIPRLWGRAEYRNGARGRHWIEAITSWLKINLYFSLSLHVTFRVTKIISVSTSSYLWLLFHPLQLFTCWVVKCSVKLETLSSYNASCAILRRFTAVCNVTTTSSWSIVKLSVWVSLKPIKLHSNTSTCSIVVIGSISHQHVIEFYLNLAAGGYQCNCTRDLFLRMSKDFPIGLPNINSLSFIHKHKTELSYWRTIETLRCCVPVCKWLERTRYLAKCVSCHKALN